MIILSIFKKLAAFVYDRDLVINIYQQKVNVINYLDIAHFDDNKVIIKHNQGIVKIKGFKLVVSKLLDYELLIKGDIKSIELE